MKRKASLSTLSYNDPNQGVLTYANDGEKELGIIYSDERISRFDQIPPYGQVLVNGKDSEMVLMRLSDGSILCFKSSSGSMKLKDQEEKGRGQRWCHNYSCIHVSLVQGPESSKFYSTENQDPYSLGRCDSRTHGNIRRYVTNLMKPGETGLVKPECRFTVPKEYGGNGKEGIIKFPIKAIDFRKKIITLARNSLYIKFLFERETGFVLLEEIYHLIVHENRELFFIR